MTHLFTGTICEIGPAFSMDSGRRDHYDEWTGCEAQVLRVGRDGDVLVYINTIGDVWVNAARLRVRRAP